MTSKNDITGDSLITKTSTDAYRSGWDTIFKPKVENTTPTIDLGEFENSFPDLDE